MGRGMSKEPKEKPASDTKRWAKSKKGAGELGKNPTTVGPAFHRRAALVVFPENPPPYPLAPFFFFLCLFSFSPLFPFLVCLHPFPPYFSSLTPSCFVLPPLPVVGLWVGGRRRGVVGP